MKSASFLLKFLVLLALVSISTACSSGGGGGDESNGDSGNGVSDDDETPTDAGARLTVTTFNTGLLPDLVPLSDERVGPIASAVAAHDADVICLQEIWQEADLNTIVSRVSPSFPYLAAVPAVQKLASSAPVCSIGELESIINCVLSSCTFTTTGFFECLVSTCSPEVNELGNSNPECAQALTAQAGRSASDVIEIQETLFSGTDRAGLFAFGGSSGLLLASKLPLSDVQVVDFADISTVSRRAAILARVTKDGVSHVVGCTHLQSNFEGILPYTGSQGSWAGEHLAQAGRLIAAADAYAGGEPISLAGDFNCSIGSGAVRPELESGCRAFLDNGFEDPAAALGRCSYCESNSLNQAAGAIVEGVETLLDHVFVRGGVSDSASDIVFEAPASVAGGTANISDHYGVRVLR